MGTPRGVMAMSSLAVPASTSSLVSCAADRLAYSMSSAMRSNSTLPAIWKAGSVTPRTLKIHFPARAKSINTPAATRHANRAIRNWAAGGSFEVMAMKAGTTAIGSTITNSELTASRMYSVRLMAQLWSLGRRQYRPSFALLSACQTPQEALEVDAVFFLVGEELDGDVLRDV